MLLKKNTHTLLETKVVNRTEFCVSNKLSTVQLVATVSRMYSSLVPQKYHLITRC